MPPRSAARSSTGDDLARVHDRNVVAEHLRLIHVMGGQDDRRAPRLDTLHERPEISPRLRIEARRRLVQKYEPGPVDECHGQEQALPLAAGQLAIVTLEQVTERTVVDDARKVSATVVKATEHLERFPYRQVVLQRRALELDAGLLAKPRPGRFAVIKHLARTCRRDSFDDFHGGGLACAIRAQQAKTGAFGDGEAHVIDRDNAGVAFFEVPGFESGLHGARKGA